MNALNLHGGRALTNMEKSQITQHAVILAAGKGSRLDPAYAALPKCLQRVGGKPLIEHQVRVLQHFGIGQITVVVGAGAGMVKSWLAGATGVQFIENERYEQTNSLYSLLLAGEVVREPFLLLNCDVLAHPSIYRTALAGPGTTLVYDSSSGRREEEMKVTTSADGRLVSISKTLPNDLIHGENVGMIRIGAELVKPLFAAAKQLVEAGGEREWAPQALNQLASQHHIECVDICGRPWIEIDFAEDLIGARERVWPRIERAMMQIDTCRTRSQEKALKAGERWRGHTRLVGGEA